MISLFKVPHIMRCNRHESGVFRDTGFDCVYCGKVVVAGPHLKIFEFKDDIATASPVLVIPFTNVQSIEKSLFRSGGGRYKGGQVRIVGRFDREVNGIVLEEMVTFQMPLDAVYHDFVETLEHAMSVFGNN